MSNRRARLCIRISLYQQLVVALGNLSAASIFDRVVAVIDKITKHLFGHFCKRRTHGVLHRTERRIQQVFDTDVLRERLNKAVEGAVDKSVLLRVSLNAAYLFQIASIGRTGSANTHCHSAKVVERNSVQETLRRARRGVVKGLRNVNPRQLQIGRSVLNHLSDRAQRHVVDQGIAKLGAVLVVLPVLIAVNQPIRHHIQAGGVVGISRCDAHARSRRSSPESFLCKIARPLFHLIRIALLSEIFQAIQVLEGDLRPLRRIVVQRDEVVLLLVSHVVVAAVVVFPRHRVVALRVLPLVDVSGLARSIIAIGDHRINALLLLRGFLASKSCKRSRYSAAAALFCIRALHFSTKVGFKLLAKFLILRFFCKLFVVPYKVILVIFVGRFDLIRRIGAHRLIVIVAEHLLVCVVGVQRLHAHIRIFAPILLKARGITAPYQCVQTLGSGLNFPRSAVLIRHSLHVSGDLIAAVCALHVCHVLIGIRTAGYGLRRLEIRDFARHNSNDLAVAVLLLRRSAHMPIARKALSHGVGEILILR